jgi:hypothetical protein
MLRTPRMRALLEEPDEVLAPHKPPIAKLDGLERA